MEQYLLPAWRGRRVLLASGGDETTAAMHALLTQIGARPACIPISSDSETYFRALSEGRSICLIAPDLNSLAVQPPARRLTAMQAMLCEAHEAGTPLTMLLARREDVSSLQGQALAHLAAHAKRAASAHCCDALALQWIWHEHLSAQEVCMRALSLGARYLMGDHACLGSFAINESI